MWVAEALPVMARAPPLRWSMTCLSWQMLPTPAILPPTPRAQAAAMCTAMSAAQQEVVAKAYSALPSEHKSIVGSLLPPGDLTALLGSPGCPRSLRPPRRNRRVSICAPVAPNLFALTHLAGPMGEVPQEVDPKSVDALVLHEMLVAMTELSGGAHAPEAGAGDACADQGGPSVAGQGPAGEGGAQGPDAGGVKAGGPKSAEGAAVARAWQVLGEKRRAVFDLSGVAVARGAVMRGRDGRKARRREVSWGQQGASGWLSAQSSTIAVVDPCFFVAPTCILCAPSPQLRRRRCWPSTCRPTSAKPCIRHWRTRRGSRGRGRLSGWGRRPRRLGRTERTELATGGAGMAWRVAWRKSRRTGNED